MLILIQNPERKSIVQETINYIANCFLNKSSLKLYIIILPKKKAINFFPITYLGKLTSAVLIALVALVCLEFS